MMCGIYKNMRDKGKEPAGDRATGLFFVCGEKERNTQKGSQVFRDTKKLPISSEIGSLFFCSV